MDRDEAFRLLIAGIDRLLGMGPVLGPSRETRALLTAARAAVVADPSIIDRILPFVGPYRSEEGACDRN